MVNYRLTYNLTIPMSKQIQLAKACIICGLQKPISAFLQISGPQGTSYGNVCSSCRGTTDTNKTVVIKKTEEERGGSGSGLKIDAKAKMEIERDQKEAADKKETLDKEEADKELEASDDKAERKSERELTEKKHRENFIEPKKSDSFFTRKGDTQSLLNRTLVEKQNLDKNITKEAQTKLENRHLEEGIKQESKEKGIDLTDIATDQLIGGKVKMQRLNQIKSWFGSAAPMSTVERQFNSTQAEKNTSKEGKDTLVDFVKENWDPKSPGSKRR